MWETLNLSTCADSSTDRRIIIIFYIQKYIYIYDFITVMPGHWWTSREI